MPSAAQRRTCRGTAISAATNADKPLNALFVAAAVDERPTFASTMYASVLAYIDLIVARPRVDTRW